MKNLNVLKSIVLSLALGVSFAAAENLLTYTASSKVSQKDADQKALDGVAKQMSTRVKSEMETRKSEDAKGNITETADMFKGSYTNVVLKGAKIVPGPKKDNQFTSTVSVDLDQLASKILLDLETIRNDVKEKEKVVRVSLKAHDYYKTSVDMSTLEKLVDRYNEELENLSCVQGVPADLKLDTRLNALSEFFMDNLQSLQMETELSSEALIVSVKDYAKPVAFMPIALVQDRKNLVVEKTDDKGQAIFDLKDVMSRKPSGEVTVLPDLKFKYVRLASIVSKTVAYSAEKRDCAYRLTCKGETAECGALRKFMLESGFSFVDAASAPELVATLDFSDKANSGKTLYTSKGTISLKSGDVEMVEQPQGVGRDSESAHVKAITKLPATKILQAFVNKNCKK